MRAAFAFLLCLTFGCAAMLIPPTIFWFPWTYELTGDRNLAWGLVFGLAIGVAVGLTAACTVRGFLSRQWFIGASTAFAMALFVGVSATALAYREIAMFPEPLMQAPQGPFWIIHPGTFIGIFSTSAAAVTIGQLAGPWKAEQR